MLTDQAETFIGQYQSSRYPTGHTGDYPAASFQPADQRSGEYRQYRGDAPASAGRYPAYNGEQGQSGQQGHSGQPGRGTDGNGRLGLPAGQYDAQQQRPSQQQRPGGQPHQSQPQQPAQAQLPAATPGGSSGGRPSGSGGLNPYDAGVTGSYPYPNQSYPTRPATTGPAQDGADDRYYRPAPPDGRNGNGNGAGQDRNGYGGNYGSSYPAPADRRY